jgi:chaperone required for assembly of F1-ATPase
MALTKAFHWQQEDYFPYLLKNVKKAVIALEYLVDDIHEDKDKTVEQFLRHVESDKLIYGLISLMSSDNLRVSGNSAYVFGTIAENDNGIERIMTILNKENANQTNPESDNFLLYLVNLLRSTDYECLMNAAGTIGTIVIFSSFMHLFWSVNNTQKCL